MAESRLPGLKRLLIIDDERRMADSLKSLFEASGYCADVAYSGAEGLAKIGQGQYHVIITDIRMPDCDGYEIMRFVNEHSPKSLAIVITGYASTESAIEAIHQSAFDYIPKPYDFDKLRTSVERAFSQIEARQMREDLISMITHDIKVPLGTIIGYAQMALEGQGGFHPRAREFLELISISGQRILSLVDNFLATCRVEAGHMEIAEVPVDLVEIIEDVQPIAELEARKREVELTIRVEADQCRLRGDGSLLFRALCNLFNNAIKYAERGGSVEAVLRVAGDPPAGETGAWALFEIRNTGEGIAPEDLSLIFDRYSRARRSAGGEGAGLGLYVVWYIVRAHKGRIEVESQLGQMTVFRVYLPLLETSPLSSDATGGAPSP